MQLSINWKRIIGLDYSKQYTNPYFGSYFTVLIVINWACITLILNIAIIANILTLNVQVSTSVKKASVLFAEDHFVECRNIKYY